MIIALILKFVPFQLCHHVKIFLITEFFKCQIQKSEAKTGHMYKNWPIVNNIFDRLLKLCPNSTWTLFRHLGIFSKKIFLSASQLCQSRSEERVFGRGIGGQQLEESPTNSSCLALNCIKVAAVKTVFKIVHSLYVITLSQS